MRGGRATFNGIVGDVSGTWSVSFSYSSWFRSADSMRPRETTWPGLAPHHDPGAIKVCASRVPAHVYSKLICCNGLTIRNHQRWKKLLQRFITVGLAFSSE
jgi:hypothetical protein